MHDLNITKIQSIPFAIETIRIASIVMQHVLMHNNRQGSIWDFFWGGDDPEKIFGATQRREKIFLGLQGGPGACSPGKF